MPNEIWPRVFEKLIQNSSKLASTILAKRELESTCTQSLVLTAPRCSQSQPPLVNGGEAGVASPVSPQHNSDDVLWFSDKFHYIIALLVTLLLTTQRETDRDRTRTLLINVVELFYEPSYVTNWSHLGHVKSGRTFLLSKDSISSKFS